MQRTLSVVDLPAIRNNALMIKRISGEAKFFAVVKADAYGHGAEEVARCIEDVADGFCVAIVEEGIALRVAGISKPVLVFTPPLDRYDVRRAAAYRLSLTVNGAVTAKMLDGAPCHIKVNTGMNRMGCSIDELPAVLNELPPESVEGVYSHLFAPHDSFASERQRALFERAAAMVKTVRPEACAHLSASGGLLRGAKYAMDGVRCGILLYGYAPYGFRAEGFCPAMKVYARRAQQTRFIGGGVGYHYADRTYKTLSAYRLGYADGFARGVPLGEKSLCMDSFLSESEENLLCVMRNAEEYAKRCGTIPYEVLVNVSHRSERIYER